jgi:epoxyqueuosine reductase
MPNQLRESIQETANRLGFDLCGIAPATLPEKDRLAYLGWLENGCQGEMKYMERREREDIQRLLPGARSVICLGMVYNTPEPLSINCAETERGWIARYAWGEDYHFILEERLKKLLDELRAIADVPFEAKVYVDTGPLLERAVAQAAGLGWIAKNTCLIHPKAGSWFLLGEILTTLEIEQDQALPDYCGSCTRCMDACPTGAIVEPYVLDATRCISYLTIELKGSIPEDFRAGMGRHVFGCDICQDVCPWNRKAPTTALAAFQPRPIERKELASEIESVAADEHQVTTVNHARGAAKMAALHVAEDEHQATAMNPTLEKLADLSEDEFREIFRRSPVKRTRYRGLLRNVSVAMGNSGRPEFRPTLERLAQHADPIVAEHARWALGRLSETQSQDSQHAEDAAEYP